MGVTVLVAYRPKPGEANATALVDLVREHVPILRDEGLATERQVVALRGRDGTVLEMFEWKDRKAMDAAHENKVVQGLWSRFAAVCDYVPLKELPEAEDLFAEFELIEL